MNTMLPVLRRSAVEAAAQCLYRYDAIWNKGADDMSDPAMRGIAFHACANRYIRKLVEKQVPQDQEESHLAFLEGIADVERLPARLVPEVRDLFDRWAENFDLDVSQYVASEERTDRSEQTFTPDLVLARPNELEIIDFKTFWVPLTEVQAKADFQARWYIRNAHIQWPRFAVYRFTFSFVRLGKHVSVTFNETELDQLAREVDAVMARIHRAAQTGIWPATPGEMCSFCDLACPVVDQIPVLAKRFTPEQAPKVAAWLLAAERQTKAMKKALKAYCSSHGPVSVQGVEFDNRPIAERRYPVDKLMAVLEQRKIGGAFENASEDGLTISHSALAKLFKAHPMLVSDLAPFMQSKEKWRFSARQAGESGDEGDES
jgi:hypothetical protein